MLREQKPFGHTAHFLFLSLSNEYDWLGDGSETLSTFDSEINSCSFEPKVINKSYFSTNNFSMNKLKGYLLDLKRVNKLTSDH